MKLFFLSMIILFAMQKANAQKTWTIKDSMTVSRLETMVYHAEVKLKTADDKVSYADSLIQVGNCQLNKGKSQTKKLKDEEKFLRKQYESNRKALQKVALSIDKEKAMKAKEQLKEMNSLYKKDYREVTAKIRSNDQLISNGNRNLEKGKNYSKDYRKKQKEAEEGLITAKGDLDRKMEELNQDQTILTDKGDIE